MAYQEGFLDRPIINKYLKVDIHEKAMTGDRMQTEHLPDEGHLCDVEHPHQDAEKLDVPDQNNCLRSDPQKIQLLGTKNTFNYFASRFGNYSFDPYLSAIYWIMDINEKAGNRVTFYFKAGRTDPQFDSAYSLDEPIIRKLLRDIHNRGHEIGLHPSYHTYRDAKQLCLEADNLRRVLEEENICQDILGSRQHYLRWDSATTPSLLEKAGIDYDTTLSYADHAGFRCGVCYEYPIYHWVLRSTLNVNEIPLIVMECSFFSKTYMGLSAKTALDSMMLLKNMCIIYNGLYVLLWHNDYIMKKRYIELVAEG